VPHDPTKSFVPYATVAEFARQQPTPEALVDLCAGFGWAPAFLKLSELACKLSSAPGAELSEEVRRVTSRLLARYRFAPDALLRVIGEYFEEHPERPIAQEPSIYLVQALMLLHGNESEDAPDEYGIPLLLLNANTFVDQWRDPDPTALSELEQAVADAFRASRYVERGSRIPTLIRTWMLYQMPFREPMSADERDRIEQAAFDGPFEQYFESFVFPLYLHAASWGLNNLGAYNQVVNPARWLADANVDEAWIARQFEKISVTRADAAEQIRRGIGVDGLPHSPTVFYRYPFIRIEETGSLIPASARVVQDHLITGLWARFNAGLREVRGRGHMGWFTIFGDMFEGWCRQVARNSFAETDQAHLDLLLSDGIGDDDEIEDVVIAEREANRVVLFSAKARLVPEATVRGARSRTAALEWLENFLFVEPTDEHRGGAIRLLNNKIQQIRAGQVEEIASNSTIFPVLVTYDNIGETPLLYRWLSQRCTEEGLLQQDGVASLVVMAIDDYEFFFSLMTNNLNPIEILAERNETFEGRMTPVRQAIIETAGEQAVTRPTWLDQAFNDLAGEGLRRLYNRAVGGGVAEGAD